jgi:ubiquinone biosynthesis protein
MPSSSLLERCVDQLFLRESQATLFSDSASPSKQIRAVEAVLKGADGHLLRSEMGRWISHLLPAEALVPEIYAQWRPLVRDAMAFVVSRLSDARLASKLVEQINLSWNTPTEMRLLRLIAKMPGFQKLGQVLARNRHLHPPLRDALSQLENEISDVNPEEIHARLFAELGHRLKAYAVAVEPVIFSEASVSAVVRFSWRNPRSRKQERGVFKVLKPHIPACFGEDMDLLRQLTEFLATKHREYGFAAHVLPDTFNEVRQLLEHELAFLSEQATLVEACHLYRTVPGVRIPQLIQPLCTSIITAITEEQGAKVTDAAALMLPGHRSRVAEQVLEALIAVPLFATEGQAMFHADPHAGNLLYDAPTGELVILDWALTERLCPEQQRHLALLFLAIRLRDPVGVYSQIQNLSQRGALNHRETRLVRDCVIRFMANLPLGRLAGIIDSMRLLEQLAFKGIRFPAPLIMLRKVLFTLDGILHEIAGSAVSMDLVLMRYLVQRWITDPGTIGSPLSVTDWMTVQSSAFFYGSRWWIRLIQSMLDRSRTATSASIAPPLPPNQTGPNWDEAEAQATQP